jgi:hypothetical protein
MWRPYSEGDEGVAMAWSPEHALEPVIVSPFAADWHPDTVCAVVKAFAPRLAERIDLSELGADPVY